MSRCFLGWILVVAMPFAMAQRDATPVVARSCGAVVTLETHGTSQTRYSWVAPAAASLDGEARLAVVMLVGGGGTLEIDDAGCPHRLNGNVLIRSLPYLQSAGVVTVLVDAPSDWSGEDGLAGFRLHPDHAHDLGRLIMDVRHRTHATAVWLLGHSRGTLSAANAAARLQGPMAPDGVVLASPMLSGEGARRKAWAAQTVSDVPLGAFQGPVLLIGHTADSCLRSLPEKLDTVFSANSHPRRQVVRMTGGPGIPGRAPSLQTCEVREPHDFVEQEAAFSTGILRFMRGALF